MSKLNRAQSGRTVKADLVPPLRLTKLQRAQSGRTAAHPSTLVSPSDDSRPPSYQRYLSLASGGGAPLERATSVPEHCDRVAGGSGSGGGGGGEGSSSGGESTARKCSRTKMTTGKELNFSW